MKEFLGYRCSLCGTEYTAEQLTYTCPKDGGNLDVILDYDEIKKKYQIEDIISRDDPSLWRYLPLLPVKDPGGEGTPLRMAGGTPVYSPPLLKKKLGLKNLWIKDEGRNPSASFKDRASSVVVARAREIKSEVVVTASTGNAGAALACMSAAVGQKSVIFAPRTAPAAKVAQLIVFGAQVILVDGNYDSAFDLTIEASQEFGWYCRNTGYNPFTAEGKKTGGFEIWEQVLLKLDEDSCPACIFVSVGDGNIISGIHKGLKDLQRLGWLRQMPRIFGIQSEKSAAIANTFFAGNEIIVPISATTIADSISVDLPRDGVRAVRAARETGGAYITVSDEEIITGIAELGKVGIFAEPAGSTAYAGLVKAIETKLINENDPVVVINTGNGLKDIKSAMQAVNPAPVIEPTMKALMKHLGK
ncbi:threonine synthase [Leptolinea tardivitalis]|uniref:Threonine synthase n=1 Tax=Leptolinea tardivitalis TaxID=229920 RepID=A0A0P6XIH3_9CHLR|nr:threonine synthase [Leptolinea tardivitalis]KPL74761.1 threonine synthase [Leptolinea tardivitalis]GAP22866.1 L-threonine synthase [Leptolinea tardivitalis]